MIDDQDVVGLAPDRVGDRLAVLGAEDQRTEDEQVERALQMGAVFAVGAFSYRHSTQACLYSGRMSTRTRWRWWTRPSRDLDEEIRAHLAIETERLVADGMTPEEAERTAARAFGSVTAV